MLLLHLKFLKNKIVLIQFFTSIKLLPCKGKKFYHLIHQLTGFYPGDTHLYRLAFMHKSLMYKGHNGSEINNERLEYLGDAILGAIVAHELYARYPDKNEGELTKIRSRIVNRINMNQQALRMGLGELVQTQPQTDVTQTNIPGDALEALIGAVYLDKGYKAAGRFVIDRLMSHLDDSESPVQNDTNYKSVLIEWGQKNRCEVHFVTEEYPNKPEGQNSFVASVYVDNGLAGKGFGASKKEAQQNGACEALNMLVGVGI
jgi:ribonuclease-3